MNRLADTCAEAGVPVRHDQASDRLATLIQSLHESTGHRVVVLVDEYDKPIVDNLESPDVARANRDFLSGLYGTFKACDAHIRFLMLTGVTKFSKVNLFSGLNNLTDITLDPGFATLCGYTQEELETVFAPELDAPGLEPLDRDRIREWYDGYRWLAPEPGGSGRFLDEMMAEGDLAGVESELRALFAAIPHGWHARSEIARYEGHYASVLFSYMEASGMDVRAEESSAAGRADIVAVLEDATWVFELKIDERASEGAALAQLRERGYAEKHRRRGRKVRLVGIHFSEASRTVTAFEVAEG